MQRTTYPQSSESTTRPSTAISTPAARLASSLLDRIEIERQNKGGQLSPAKRLLKMGIEAAFVPAFRREVQR